MGLRGFLIFSICLTGCLKNDSLRTLSLSESNISNLSRLSLGMDETEVLHIMHCPYKKETFFIGKDTYHVWFYITRVTGLGQTRLVPMNLTPLTFKNGVLIGYGYSYYTYVKRSLERPPAKKKKPSLEDKGIEKALNPGHIEDKPSPQEDKKLEDILNTPEKESLSMSKPTESTQETEEGEEEDSYPLDKKDEKMLEEEREQDFDFW